MVGIPTNVLMPALIAFFAVALGTASVALIFEWLQEQRRKRRMVGELRTLADEPLDPSGRGPLLRSAILDSPWLRPIAARMPALQDAELMLQQGQVGWTLQTLLFICLGTGLALSAHPNAPAGAPGRDHHGGTRSVAPDRVRSPPAQ